MSNLSYKTISEIVDDGFSKFNLRRWLPRKFRWFGSSSSPASLLCGMLCVASSSLTVLFCSLNWEMEIWAFNNAIIKKQQRRSWEARKKRRAREQQLVTHFLRSRQEPDQGVLAFFCQLCSYSTHCAQQRGRPPNSFILITVKSWEFYIVLIKHRKMDSFFGLFLEAEKPTQQIIWQKRRPRGAT